MIPLAVMGGLSLAAGITGSSLGSQRAQDAIKEIESQSSIIEEQKLQNQNLFNKQYYQNITDRTEILQLLRQMEEQQQNQSKQNAATSAIAGVTNDAQLAHQDKLNKSRADMLAQVASRASQLKDQYLNDWSNKLNSYYGQRLGQSDKIANIQQQRANNWSQMASNAYGLAFQMLGATDYKKLFGL